MDSISLSIEQLSALSYKELQSMAKTLSIAANQKKDVLVQEIFSSSHSNDENSERAINVEVSKTPQASKSTPLTPLGTGNARRVTRSTAKKTLPTACVAPVQTEEAAVVEEIESTHNLLQNDSVDEVCNANPSELTVQNAPMTPAATASEPTIETVASHVSVRFAEENEVNIMSPRVQLEEDELAEADPTTTLFDDEEGWEEPQEEEEEEQQEPEQPTREGLKIAVNRHVFFASPEAKGSAQELVAITERGPTHLHFASPELQMGKNVHWTYESFDRSDAPSLPAPTTDNSEVEDSSARETKAEKRNRTKLSPGHGDRVMNFWLTKAFADAKFFK